MRKSLCCLALAAALIPFVGRIAGAQDVKPVAVPSLDWIIATRPVPGTLTIEPLRTTHPSAPSYCSPCLFYGGDINPSAANVNGFANENTLLVPETTVFVPFTVEATEGWEVTGLFTNNLADGYDAIDPQQATWSISTGMSSGNAGAVIASGTAPATFTATGRNAFGLNEYTVEIELKQPGVRLAAGTYWLSVVPQCTDSGNSNCYIAQYFVSNTQDLNRYGPPEPVGKTLFHSAYFGYNYTNVCAVNADGCGAFSAGVEGIIAH